MISVVVALLSLAVQQHWTRQQAKTDARAKQYDRTTSLLFKAIDNPDLLEAISGNSGEDQRQRRFRQIWINHTMVIFDQRRLFTRSEWASTVDDIRDFMSNPEIRRHWTQHEEFYAPDFRDFLNREIYGEKKGDSVKEPPSADEESDQLSPT
ncbi:hypothetical protein HNR46_003198 [Haloferula luteola]|uniref:Uncharacterized protein n=1 Tax=Haloferula luteola TaxID=595692 RepID=A0A840VE89_9BACT|nr:hypothetical protein [Haloferula luteola]